MSSNASCQSISNIFRSSAYIGLITTEVIASLIAIGPNLLLAWVTWRVAVLPVNLRLLLASFSLAFVWLGVGEVSRNVYMLTAEPCSFTMSQMECNIFILGSTNLNLPYIFYSLTAMCIERLVATVIYNRYDHAAWHTKPYLACGLILVSSTVSFVVYTWGSFTLPDNVMVPICDNSFLPASPFGATKSQLYLAIEIAEAGVTAFVYFYNRYVARQMAINRARFNLSSRFLIDQNVQLNAMLVPMMTLHFLIHIPVFIVSNIKKSLVMSPLTTAVVQRWSILMRVLYAIAHPILAFHFSRHLRDQLFSYPLLATILGGLGVAQRTAVVKPKQTNSRPRSRDNNLSVHFEYLDKIWEKAKSPTKKTAQKVAWSGQKNNSNSVVLS